MVAPTSGDESSSLTIENVSKQFPSADGGIVNVLDQFSLSIAPGEIVALLGPSGCGKSTLLRLLAGLDQPTAGKLWIGSERISAPGADRGLMFQNPTLFPWKSVRGNIEAGLIARGVLSQYRHEVDELLDLIGLTAFAKAYPHQLSGGMAQRVALARALINHPRVLLLDEPLGALDQFTRMRMQDEVLQIWQSRRTTTILVTHDIDEALYLSDRIVIMTERPGRVDRIMAVQLDRPRQRNHPDFQSKRTTLLEQFHFAAGPSVP